MIKRLALAALCSAWVCLGPYKLRDPPHTSVPLPLQVDRWFGPIFRPSSEWPSFTEPRGSEHECPLESYRLFTVATHSFTSLPASLGLHASQDRELSPFLGSQLVFRQCPLGEVFPCMELESTFPEVSTTQPFLPPSLRGLAVSVPVPASSFFRWRMPGRCHDSGVVWAGRL